MTYVFAYFVVLVMKPLDDGLPSAFPIIHLFWPSSSAKECGIATLLLSGAYSPLIYFNNLLFLV